MPTSTKTASTPTSRAPTTTAQTTPALHYLWVLIALLLLLGLSAGSALFKLGAFNTLINMGISVLKTLLVMSFFMHETQARNLTRLVSALGFAWLSLLIGLALADYLTRVQVPAPW